MSEPAVTIGGHSKRIRINKGSIPALALAALAKLNRTKLEPGA